ncbi:MAG TPA: hypothetical protein VMN76_10420 [Acidobacteriota bacterium]|nr:hypothetical protein [Acidobacteriota bacterium]
MSTRMRKEIDGSKGGRTCIGLRALAEVRSGVRDLLRRFGAHWQAGFRSVVAAAVFIAASADLLAAPQEGARPAEDAGWNAQVVEQEPRPSKPHESPSKPNQPPLDAFSAIAQLEAAVDQSPLLRELALEIERLRLQRSWWNRVRLHANTSQHFSSFPLLVASPELAVSGGTFVGVTVSVPVGTLAGKTDPADLPLPLKQLEYERERERIVSSLRRMHLQRQKLLVQRRALAARIRTAGLELEKIRQGRRIAEQEPSPLLPFVFDVIDLARAEEKLAVLESDRLQADLEIEVLEIEMLALVGWRPEVPEATEALPAVGENEAHKAPPTSGRTEANESVLAADKAEASP